MIKDEFALYIEMLYSSGYDEIKVDLDETI